MRRGKSAALRWDRSVADMLYDIYSIMYSPLLGSPVLIITQFFIIMKAHDGSGCTHQNPSCACSKYIDLAA